MALIYAKVYGNGSSSKKEKNRTSRFPIVCGELYSEIMCVAVKTGSVSYVQLYMCYAVVDVNRGYTSLLTDILLPMPNKPKAIAQ